MLFARIKWIIRERNDGVEHATAESNDNGLHGDEFRPLLARITVITIGN